MNSPLFSSINSLKKSGLYNENIAVEDFYMWLKLTEDGSNLICYPKVLAKYRTHDNNTVKYLDIMYENLLNTINLYKENMYYNEALRNAKVILVKLVKNLDDYLISPLLANHLVSCRCQTPHEVVIQLMRNK